MRYIGIPFSGPMIRAILDGRKTQTRRIVKPQPPPVASVRDLAGDRFSLFGVDGVWRVAGPVWAVRRLMGESYPQKHEWGCPYGQPGDRLWVKERLEIWPKSFKPGRWDVLAAYEVPGLDGVSLANGKDGDLIFWRWKRNFLPPIFCPREASRIMLENTGVKAERLQDISEADAVAEGFASIDAFLAYWDQLHGSESREANPWVWAVSFRMLEP